MSEEKFSWWMGVIVIGMSLSFGLKFVGAWVGPTVAPSTDVIGAPIIINSVTSIQNKSGQLNVQMTRTKYFRLPVASGMNKIMKSDANGRGTWQ